MRWLFADQLGPHFLPAGETPLLIESRQVFVRRTFHRQKAHLVLSALRHRAAELDVRLHRVDRYADALPSSGVTVAHPTSYAALDLARARGIEVVDSPGWVLTPSEFTAWAGDRERLRLEDFYRAQRVRTGVLMEGSRPVGGQWNYDHDNRSGPPAGGLGLAEPWAPCEDDIDAEVRRDLDAWERSGDVSFIGVDGPRLFAATRAEALRTLQDFVDHRLADFGTYEDAMLAADGWLAHSTLSPALNLGLLDPLECVEAAVAAWRSGAAPINSVEGFVRQLIGWREYVWHVYWWGGRSYRHRNSLHVSGSLPAWFSGLDADAVEARCLSTVLAQVRDIGWTHHIPRLMVLGSWALQRGYRPSELADWFARAFVDGYEWVMTANVVGMSQHADGGLMATKPYTSGGAYISRMSDFCGACRYSPAVRVGDEACPYTAGYWALLDRIADDVRGNHRMAQPLAGLARLKDLPAVVEQERRRGSSPP
jgi:deoxyribodipyrimidine photolyase-related protein